MFARIDRKTILQNHSTWELKEEWMRKIREMCHFIAHDLLNTWLLNNINITFYEWNQTNSSLGCHSWDE